MYKMLKALQEVRDHVVVNPNMLDWDFVDEMVEALKDVAELTTRMQKEVYLMGDFFFDLFDCRHALVNHSSNNPRLADMLYHLNERTGALLSTVTYAAAIVCDPRLNTHNSLAINDRQREDAIVSTLTTASNFEIDCITFNFTLVLISCSFLLFPRISLPASTSS